MDGIHTRHMNLAEKGPDERKQVVCPLASFLKTLQKGGRTLKVKKKAYLMASCVRGGRVSNLGF